MVTVPHTNQHVYPRLWSWIHIGLEFIQGFLQFIQDTLLLHKTLQENYWFYTSVSLYFWKLHYTAMKKSNNNFLVGFPTWKLAKTFMLFAISIKYQLSFEETELAWLQHTLKPDPFWKEWEVKNS